MPNPVSTLDASSDARTLQVPGLGLGVRIQGRKQRGQAAPLVLHFHGGNFASGGLDSGDCLAELLADAGAVVASLDYPLAPAHRFPDAVEAGHATLEWLHKQRSRLAGAGAALYVAGEEAGGNLAAAVAMIARDRAGPPLAGQVLVAPMLDPCAATASLRETLGTQTCCHWAAGWQQYLRGPMDAEHPYAVPARAQRLAGMPPALILTGEDDAMRDEALAYAQRLRDAGIAVVSEKLGVPTGWPASLAEARPDECPCSEAVRVHLRTFFKPPLPPPA
jgi:acetyl esterase